MKKRQMSMLWLLFALLAAPLTSLAENQAVGRDFNHMTTGFNLSGGHATAACETCHVGGVFKGTPRNCDGCHAVGKRILATPKSNAHVVTDAPCESCHFNTVTWLGARYNHGTAVPGQCATCHNGRIAQSKHAGHVSTAIANDLCDMCHRTSTWIPASWNHTDTLSDCATCHKNGGPGRNLSAGHLPMSMPPVSFVGNCKACHTSYASFYRAYYSHAGAPTTCETCHGTYNTPVYTNVQAPTSTIHGVLPTLPVATTCSSCHKSFGSFSAARFDHVGASACSSCHNGTYSGVKGKTAGRHVVYVGAVECSSCHSTSSWSSNLSSTTLHTTYFVGQACQTCHASNSPIYGGKKDDEHGGRFNTGTPDCSSSGCHRPLGNKGSTYTDWD